MTPYPFKLKLYCIVCNEKLVFSKIKNRRDVYVCLKCDFETRVSRYHLPECEVVYGE